VDKNTFTLLAPSIPHEPGIYKYFNDKGKIIYVGKAKDLRKRVASYFNKNQQYLKTVKLVEEISKIEFTIVLTEHDALLLENTLIKLHKPKYNIDLKDGKSYPYIVIKKEPFPRIFVARNKKNDGSLYFGPYTNVNAVYETLRFLKETLPLRTCSLDLSKKNIEQKKFKVCLQYHIGNCKAPCVGFQTETEYNWHVDQIKEIIKGKLTDIVKHYKSEMETYAANYEYEKAGLIKQKLIDIETFKTKSVVANTKMKNTDVFSILSDDNYFFINYLQIEKGSIIHSFSQSFAKRLDEVELEILPNIILEWRENFNSQSTEILVPFDVNMKIEDVVFVVPLRGEKKNILDMSFKNAMHYKEEEARKVNLFLTQDSDELQENILLQLQEDLRMTELPTHIECFDNSNFQGAYPVAAEVCFKNGRPFKNEYRRFHIKTVDGINDFASMKEIVFRRYKRMLDENKPLPQLVIIDGGKGQLSSAMESIFELGLQGKMTVVGLAKNVEEIFFPGDSESIKLPFYSPSLNLIKRIRDEVHRFGITFHRKTRSKGIVKNELESIKGISEATSQKLLTHFKSVKKIKESTEEEISKIIGKAKAKIIIDYFK
jgi:excinuclease ABC subunit C